MRLRFKMISVFRPEIWVRFFTSCATLFCAHMPHSSFHLIRRINTRRGGNETNKLENRPSPVLLAKLNLEIFCFFFSLSLYLFLLDCLSTHEAVCDIVKKSTTTLFCLFDEIADKWSESCDRGEDDIPPRRRVTRRRSSSSQYGFIIIYRLERE